MHWRVTSRRTASPSQFSGSLGGYSIHTPHDSNIMDRIALTYVTVCIFGLLITIGGLIWFAESLLG